MALAFPVTRNSEVSDGICAAIERGSHAPAKTFGEPLLFKGGDFAHTDIVSVLPAGV
jgi:hypothetical protein